MWTLVSGRRLPVDPKTWLVQSYYVARCRSLMPSSTTDPKCCCLFQLSSTCSPIISPIMRPLGDFLRLGSMLVGSIQCCERKDVRPVKNLWHCSPKVFQGQVDLNAGQSPRWMHHACRIDAVDEWCLRTLLGIKWHQFVCSDEVRRITKQLNLTAIIQSRRFSIFGHIARIDNDADAIS